MYRDSTPHSIPGGLRAKMDTLTTNTARFAEVWLDDYKHFYYYMNPGEFNFLHRPMGSHHRQVALLVPDDKLDCFVQM